jgi:hypothetical protein
MPVFYNSLQLNVCDCLLFNATEMFLMEPTGGGGGGGVWPILLFNPLCLRQCFQLMRRHCKYKLKLLHVTVNITVQKSSCDWLKWVTIVGI